MTKNIKGIDVIISDIDQYMQINDINGADLTKIWDEIKRDYPTYEKWICFNNYEEIPMILLNNIGATLEDNCIEMRMSVDNFTDAQTPNIIRVNEKMLTEFLVHHTKCNPENGASGDIVKRNFSQWGIFVSMEKGKIKDYIMVYMGNQVYGEIFCIEASDMNTCRDLITCAARFTFDNGKNEILYMSNEDTMPYQMAFSAGFEIKGFYKGYKIK